MAPSWTLITPASLTLTYCLALRCRIGVGFQNFGNVVGIYSPLPLSSFHNWNKIPLSFANKTNAVLHGIYCCQMPQLNHEYKAACIGVTFVCNLKVLTTGSARHFDLLYILAKKHSICTIVRPN